MAKQTKTQEESQAAVKKADSKPAAKKTSAVVEEKIPVDACYGTGKRKSAIAKVWVFPGKGRIVINKKEAIDHVKTDVLLDQVKKPLEKLGLSSKYNCVIVTNGGGIVGQVDACLLGISRALLKVNPEFRKSLKESGFLSRDPRVKERMRK